METDRVGNADGQGGNPKKNKLSRDLRRLNSDQRMEWQGRLHISIQEKEYQYEGHYT
jgi:hypothetical protein